MAGQPLAGMDGNALAFPMQCSPDWLSSWVVLPFAAVASLEELAGGEWGGAAHPYPTALAALVAREIRSGLTGILGPEVTVTPGPQAVALSDLLRTALKDGRCLGLSLELTWSSTLVPVLHLFSAEVPVRLYQRLVHHEAAAAAAVAVPPAEAKPAGSSAQAGPHRGIGSASRTLGPFPSQSSVWAEGATVSGGERPVVKPVELPSFGDRQQQVAVEADNTQLLLDVPMNVTIELGHARLSMRDILSLGRGSTIELDRLVGEPVDVLVNGRLIAKGEVVLVDEAFGVRIIAIVPPGERLREEMSATGS
ncbi:MAG: flagellar motor switch protein FliN [Limnochordaceae bacterium]|nr:flagellar motor switch protein FliN [Limnochordaceae bacterium]